MGGVLDHQHFLFDISVGHTLHANTLLALFPGLIGNVRATDSVVSLFDLEDFINLEKFETPREGDCCSSSMGTDPAQPCRFPNAAEQNTEARTILVLPCV